MVSQKSLEALDDVVRLLRLQRECDESFQIAVDVEVVATHECRDRGSRHVKLEHADLKKARADGECEPRLWFNGLDGCIKQGRESLNVVIAIESSDGIAHLVVEWNISLWPVAPLEARLTELRDYR